MGLITRIRKYLVNGSKSGVNLSDITKKIFSIESPREVEKPPHASLIEVVKPLDNKDNTKDKLPDFVTREMKAPIILGAPEDRKHNSTSWIMWTGLGLTLIWLIGAALMFSDKFFAGNTDTFETAGLIVLIALPAMLITLLWISLRQLVTISNRNMDLANAANALITPETEALSRTQTLAGGIKAEISSVNGKLSETVNLFKSVQTEITRESQALDAAGIQLSHRSEDVGRNLTLQRQALESISGTFDSKMETMATQIQETGKTLEASSESVATRIESSLGAIDETTSKLTDATSSMDQSLSTRVSELGDISRKIDETSEALKSDLNDSIEILKTSEESLSKRGEMIDSLSVSAQEKIDVLTATLGSGQQSLRDLEKATLERSEDLNRLYDGLAAQIQKSEDETLASQGRTTRMVEGNLAQMRRDLSNMEAEMQALQSRIRTLRGGADNTMAEEPSQSRLLLTPLDSDFPPVEPPRPGVNIRPAYPLNSPDTELEIPEEPLNLGADLQIETPDDALTNFEPDVIKRPGGEAASAKGFGRATAENKKPSGWRWKDMLGGLDRPAPTPPAQTLNTIPGRAPKDSINIQDRLDRIDLSPAAIVDEGTIIDATQARINNGETGLAETVRQRLSDPISHLQKNMNTDAALASDVKQFVSDFSERVSSTPIAAPALRAVYSSPDGRAYLLCAAAISS